MSSPHSRLVSDDVAEVLGRDAEAILSAQPPHGPMVRGMAAGIAVLLRDRGARQELAAMTSERGAEVVTCVEDTV